MTKMLKTFLRVSQVVSKVTQHVPRVSKALQRDGLCLRDSRGLENIPKNNLMVLKTCQGSVPLMPCCLQHKDMWERVTKPSVPLPFTRANYCAVSDVLFMSALQKGVFKSIFTKNCVTSRVSNWWNVRRKDFQCKAGPVRNCEMKLNSMNSALQIPIRPYWHFQNQTGTWAPASTLVTELQHISPKQKSKQAKNYATFFFIQLDAYIIRGFSISQQHLCVWVPEKDILSPSLPTAAAYSFLPLKHQSGENGSVFPPQGSLSWQSSAIPQAQLSKTIKIIISLKQLLGWELITRLFPFLTCYLKSSLS